MSDESGLSEYTVEINGIEHTLQLDEEAAKRYGDAAKAVSAKAQKAPANKAAKPADK